MLQEKVLNYLIHKTRPTPISVNLLGAGGSIYSPAHSITTLEAFRELGTTSLASHIMRLKRKGYQITSKWIEVSNRYGHPCRIKLYTLVLEPQPSATPIQPTNPKH